MKESFGDQLKAGLKYTIEESLFDLCGQEPRTDMDIYITEDGKFSCGQPKYYTCHFIGNVKPCSSNFYGCGYSVYVVSIKRDINPSRGNVEIKDNFGR